MVDCLEYYTEKDLEKCVYGTCDICALVLYDRLLLCNRVRKNINYQPYADVKSMLIANAYSTELINTFSNRINSCRSTISNEEPLSSQDLFIQLVDVLEYCIMKKIEECSIKTVENNAQSYYKRLKMCLSARQEIDYEPYNNIQALFKSHGYHDEYIKQYLDSIDVANI